MLQYVLNKVVKVIPYILQHLDEIKFAHPQMSEKWTLKEYNKTFLSWFKKKVYTIPNVSKTLFDESRPKGPYLRPWFRPTFICLFLNRLINIIGIVFLWCN